ncbi:Major facilitator superfamily transporter [Colletotrichum higginsianum IMI 349063]|uniref:Major facilitator superfamily transporter n=1 Tax=Colletotrichum higginsianum (strain IMI 349063) TaxID=759273 RepID=A0A1B7XZQ1_COLHI|nr:Major facilitator superfamily transporter [Colletotrichum higginsianum IMI 349063]OBR05243.1 Major facilitator superfamily transporter [Colletotrichum higginsianum IMI 349063]
MSTPPDQARDAEKRHATQMTDTPVRSGSDLEKSGSSPSVLQPSSSDDNRSRVAQDKDTGRDPDAGDGPDVNADAVTIVGQALSRATSRSSITPAPPPDGGVTAWMAINSFGVFQSYYTTLLFRPPSDIAWIGSFEVFLLFFISTFSGRLTDAGYFRTLFAAGFLLVSLGMLATSFCTQYWQFFLAQGICLGIGNGCLFCPALSTASTYFDKRRGLALGFVSIGSSTGGLIYPTMVRQLLPSIGFGWTIRAIAFVQMGTLMIAFVFLRPRVKPRKAGSIVEWAAFKELEYTFYAIGSLLNYLGVFFAFYYLASYTRDIIGLSYNPSLNLLLVLNGVGVPGRILPGYIADRVGSINTLIPMSFISGLLMYCWVAVSSTSGLYTWTPFYGLAASAIQSLFPSALSQLTSDPRKQGTRMGMTFTIVSFAVLTGPPIAGAIISAEGGRYVGAQVYAGTCLLAGMCFWIAARVVKTRKAGGGLWFKT